MIVDLLSVGDRPVPFEFALDSNEIDLETNGVKVVGEVSVAGEVRVNAARTDVTGSVKVPLEVDCTRCLVSLKRDLDLDFRATYIGREMFPETKETEIESGDLDTDFIEGTELDLNSVVREQILLNLPEQILCRDNCRGLCPKCGVDLNEGDCQCGEDDIDPRWAALKNLK